MIDLKKTYDAIVIGSGAAGGVTAKELCEGGLRVLLLEAGPRLVHTTLAKQCQAEIEVIAMIGTVPLDRLAKRVFRLLQPSGASEGHPQSIPGRRICRVDRDRVSKAGKRRVKLTEIALQFAKLLADGRIPRQKRESGFERSDRFAWPAQTKAHLSLEDSEVRSTWILPTAFPNDGERRFGTIGRQTRFRPPRPRLFEQRRPACGFLEMRSCPIETLQPGERSREIQMRFEALDAAADQLFEAACR